MLDEIKYGKQHPVSTSYSTIYATAGHNFSLKDPVDASDVLSGVAQVKAQVLAS